MTTTPPRASIREVTPGPGRDTGPSPARQSSRPQPPPRPDAHPAATRSTASPTSTTSTASTSRPFGRPAPRPASILDRERASFAFAFEGLRYAWSTQRHLRIHASLALLACGLGLFFTITPVEWAALVAVIALVTVLELLNTVVEVVVDMVTTDYHPKAKVAKDVAAGAVLVAASGALLTGAFIFVPRLAALLPLPR